MIEIKITGETPLEALSSLTAFGTHCRHDPPVAAASDRILEAEMAGSAKRPVETAAPPQPTPTAPQPAPSPVGTAPTPAAPAPGPTTAPAPAPAPSPAPSASAPSNFTGLGTESPKYSIDDIARAGAELAQQGPDKITALTNLLAQFGLQAVTQLRPEQMGPFVMALRGLGARI